MIENGVRKKRPHTGISRGNDCDEICVLKFVPSRHAIWFACIFVFDSGALSIADGGRKCGAFLIFCQTVVHSCAPCCSMHANQMAWREGANLKAHISSRSCANGILTHQTRLPSDCWWLSKPKYLRYLSISTKYYSILVSLQLVNKNRSFQNSSQNCWSFAQFRKMGFFWKRFIKKKPQPCLLWSLLRACVIFIVPTYDEYNNFTLQTSSVRDDSWFTRGTTWQTRGPDEREQERKIESRRERIWRPLPWCSAS